MNMTIPQIKTMLDKADEQEYKALERALSADTRKGVKSALAKAKKRLDGERKERERLESLYAFEQSFADGPDDLIVGLDEVGRGSVAGPLAVGAVVLPRLDHIEGLNDSKQINPDRRIEIAQAVKQRALAWTVAYISPNDIDRDGMTMSLRRAFSQALADIDSALPNVSVVLIDGNPIHIDPREKNVVKGDARCASIAAASIVAKTERDLLMIELSERYPAYELDVNKGYASPQHIEAIRSHGLSPIHRSSFCRSFMQETLF